MDFYGLNDADSFDPFNINLILAPKMYAISN